MDYAEVMQRLIEMKSRYDIGFSSIDRTFLDSLYNLFYGKPITRTGCSDCYRDAYHEILYKLKREKAMPVKSSFKLKPGAVITFFGEAVAYTNANLTDEVAVRYLAKNVNNSNLFDELPDGWKDMVEIHTKNCTNDNTPKGETSTVAMTSELIAEKEARIAELEKALEAAETDKKIAETEAFNIREELSSANNSLEMALEENEALRKEVEELKASKTKTTKSKTKKAEEAPVVSEEAPAGEGSIDL